MHFLTNGAANGEPVLFITLAETVTRLRRTAEGLGFNVAGISFLDLSPTSEFFAQVQTYDIFSPAEVSSCTKLVVYSKLGRDSSSEKCVILKG